MDIAAVMASIVRLIRVWYFVVSLAAPALAAGGSICSNSSAAPYTLKQLATICDETFAVTNAVCDVRLRLVCELIETDWLLLF